MNSSSGSNSTAGPEDERPEIVQDSNSGFITVTYDSETAIEPGPFVLNFDFQHDEQKRVFVIKSRDGKIERFRDNPVRFLIVAPDPQSGQMRPAITHRGTPMYLWLCREEVEKG
jgi:hypothetical protein